jgi:hypothetical protein
MAPGVGWGHNRENCFYIFFYMKYNFKNLLENHWAKKVEIYMKAFRHSTKASLLKS